MLLPIQIFYYKYKSYFVITGLLGLFLSGVYAGYRVNETSHKLAAAKELEDAVAAKEKAEKADEKKAIELETKESALSKLERTLKSRLKNEIHIDNNCVVPASVVQLINAAN